MCEYKNIFGLIGYPLGHSFSKKFFNEKFLSENLNAEYRNFEISSIQDFSSIIQSYPQLKGLNVTIPYKKDILPFLKEIDNDALEIGAVNVIKIMEGVEGKYLKGYNTDVIGFINSIKPLLMSHHTKALILGTGGASRAVEYGLNKLGIKTQLVSRNSSVRAISYDEITPALIAEYTIIVNTTPLGMYPKIDNAPKIPYNLITEKHLCYDLVYNPTKTLFLSNSEKHGATIKNGAEMLKLQALEAWKIWNN